MILSFRCYSERNSDFSEVYFREKRFRGCSVGEPMIVRGINIQDSERNLGILKEALYQLPNINIISNKRGSFMIELTE